MALDVKWALPVEVRVRSGLLIRRDILGFPVEKEIKRFVDGVGEYRRVNNVIPHRGGRKDGFPTEDEVHEGGSITSNESGPTCERQKAGHTMPSSNHQRLGQPNREDSSRGPMQ